MIHEAIATAAFDTATNRRDPAAYDDLRSVAARTPARTNRSTVDCRATAFFTRMIVWGTRHNH